MSLLFWALTRCWTGPGPRGGPRQRPDYPHPLQEHGGHGWLARGTLLGPRCAHGRGPRPAGQPRHADRWRCDLVQVSPSTAKPPAPPPSALRPPPPLPPRPHSPRKRKQRYRERERKGGREASEGRGGGGEGGGVVVVWGGWACRHGGSTLLSLRWGRMRFLCFFGGGVFFVFFFFFIFWA